MLRHEFYLSSNVSKANALESRLTVQLQNSDVQSGLECPFFAPSVGTKLLKDYAEQAQHEGIDSGNLLLASPNVYVCITQFNNDPVYVSFLIVL